ncbi:hypothetical protein [Listeria costaricensis]|uniref:hypothetical protein n=1 Tax=Listeria costaricensis TaxID=2026604 RepID=UPI000C07C6E8|nr:hypothetical protein [Listeria costaricensis]
MEEKLDVLYKGRANVKDGFKAYPGVLFLTHDLLIHKPSDYFDPEINLHWQDIAQISGVKTKILGKEMLSNLLKVEMKNGTTYQFVVNKQKKWLEAIEDLLEQRNEKGKLNTIAEE